MRIHKSCFVFVFLFFNCDLSMDFNVNIRQAPYFIVLGVVIYWAMHMQHGKFQFYIEITSQVLTIDPRWKLNYERAIMSLPYVYVHVIHVRQILTAIRLKIWTSLGTSFWFFLSQQDLHFSREAGFEQRVWLLSLLVKCLKKTCNLNCCRAHQYEIGRVGEGCVCV